MDSIGRYRFDYCVIHPSRLTQPDPLPNTSLRKGFGDTAQNCAQMNSIDAL